MFELLSQPWPWWVAGPLLGLVVPVLLLLAGKPFGISSSLRHTCAAALPGRADYFAYDWRSKGLWNLVFVVGLVLGGVVAGTVLAPPDPVIDLAPETRADLAALGIQDDVGLAPAELFSWSALGTPVGLTVLVLGGLLLGFGARWAGGCTSGHGITGVANLQLPSLVAALAFFAGGLAVTYGVLPWLLRGIGS